MCKQLSCTHIHKKVVNILLSRINDLQNQEVATPTENWRLKLTKLFFMT